MMAGLLVLSKEQMLQGMYPPVLVSHVVWTFCVAQNPLFITQFHQHLHCKTKFDDSPKQLMAWCDSCQQQQVSRLLLDWTRSCF